MIRIATVINISLSVTGVHQLPLSEVLQLAAVMLGLARPLSLTGALPRRLNVVNATSQSPEPGLTFL